MKAVATNRKAYHDYEIEDTVEAGLILTGTEVKSLRAGRANLTDGYVTIVGTEAYLLSVHISPYTHGNIANHDPLRKRKLLMKARELERLAALAARKGYTLVPLKMYFKGPWVKLEIGLARGKKVFEKRESIKEREAYREIDRVLKSRNR
jgi:SsrA-binding protein